METSKALDVLLEAQSLEIDSLTNEEKPKEAVTYSEEEQAAARFLYLLPYIKKLGKAMGQKGVVRVLHALAEFPLSEGKPKLLDAYEKQLFDIFQELQSAKTVIIKNTLEKQKASANDGEVQETVKEEVNGTTKEA